MLKSRFCRLLCGILLSCVCILYAVYGLTINVRADEEYKIYAEAGDVTQFITGTGSYFGVAHSFYRDSKGRVVYCLQSGIRGAEASGTSGYQEDGNSAFPSAYIEGRIKEIVSKGYPSQFGTFITGGSKDCPQYITGLLIDGRIVECTEDEARAATAFSIHRQMIEYQNDNQENSPGNHLNILSYKNGGQSVHDVAGIHELMMREGKEEQADITINWLGCDEEGNMIVSAEPVPLDSDLDNMYVYAEIISDNCVVNSISMISDEGYVQGGMIEDVSYVSPFKRTVKLRIPRNDSNNRSKVGLACSSSTGGETRIDAMTNEGYQDVIVIPQSKGLFASIEGRLPNGRGGVLKLDYDTKNPIPGVGFGVYTDPECKHEIAAMETDAEGQASVDELESGLYYVREIYTPYGYIIDDEIYEMKVQPNSISELIIYNKRIPIEIIVEKHDMDNKSMIPQGDATFTNAVYGLYAREDIVRLDGHEGFVYRKDELVCNIVLGDNNRGHASGLYPGKYYIREITPPVGYTLNETEYEADCSVGSETKYVKLKVIVEDKSVKQAFQLIKFHGSEGEEQLPLEGAGFKAWLLSDLPRTDSGVYDVTDVKPYSIGVDGEEELFTDRDGYACSAELPYGTYLVRETTVPDGFLPLDDFIVTINEDSRTPQTLRMFNDESVKARLKIIKADKDTGNTILKAGYEFKIFDINNNCYVRQRVTYPQDGYMDSYFTNNEGYLILPNPLEAGKYRIEEVSVPEESGYALNTSSVEIEISAQNAVYMESGEGAVIEVWFYNEPLYGSLIIHKKFEQRGDESEPNDSNADSDSVIFGLYAEEDIFTYDFHKSESGSRNIIYTAGQRVRQIKIGDDGYGCADMLPLGRYYLVEEKTLNGYVKASGRIPIEIKASVDRNEAVLVELELMNKLTEAYFVKKDAETGRSISGAILVIKDYLGNIIDRWESDVNPHVVKGLTEGMEYTFIEEYAPYGYLKADDINFTYEPEEDGALYEISMSDRSPRGRICIDKTGDIISQVVWRNSVDGIEEGTDILYSEAQLSGVEFKLYAAEDITSFDGSGSIIYKRGSEVSCAVTDETGVALFDDLPLGRYIIVETKTGSEHIIKPYSIPVALDYKDQYTEIIEADYAIKNERIENRIKIYKCDGDTKKPLANAWFGLYAGEDVYGSDGTLIFPEDYLILKCQSDAEGAAELHSSLVPASYYIREITAPSGYKLSDECYGILIKECENTEISIDIENYKDGVVLGASGGASENDTSQQIRTGDDYRPVVAVMLVLVIAAIVFLSVCYYLKGR